MVDFSLLADYLSVELTSKKIIKVAKNRKYFTSIQSLLEISFNFSHAIWIAKLLLDNNTIRYVIYLIYITNKANIETFLIKYKHVIKNFLTAKLYVIVYKLNIKKQHWERYQIIKKKLY